MIITFNFHLGQSVLMIFLAFNYEVHDKLSQFLDEDVLLFNLKLHTI